MTPVDYIIVGLCAVSAGLGFIRGFTREALALVTLLAAIWLAGRFAGVVEPYLGEWAGQPEVRIWVARLIVFLAALAAGAIVSSVARQLVRHSGLSGADRLIGAAFGVVRGGLLVGLAAILLEFTGLDQDPLWQGAHFRGYAEQIADAIRRYAEIGTRYLREQPPGDPAV